MATINSSKLSASGSAFALNSVDLDDGKSKENISSFQTIPSQITTIFDQKGFVWAFSVLVPKRISYESRAEIADDSKIPLTGSYVYTEEDQDTYFGPSISYRINRQLSVGLSIFIDKLDYRYAADQIMREEGTENYFLQTDRRYINAMVAIPIIGVLIRPNKKFSLGVRFSGPNKRINGKFEHLVKTSDNTSAPEVNGAQIQNYSYNYEKPLDLGVGISWKTTQDLVLLFDISNQFKKSFVSTSTDLFGSEEVYRYNNVQRYNLGIEYRTSHTDNLTFGFNYNPDPFEGQNLNFTGFTIGYRTLEKIADTSVGLFYNFADNTDESKIKTKVQIFGLFLSTAIDFKY